MNPSIEGVSIPDSKLAREVTELVRDTESELLFNHSSRVFYFGALAGRHRGLSFDPELLYVGTMFHEAFYEGIRRKPDTTFGNVKADVIADKERTFQRGNFCRVIRESAWRG